LSPSCHPSESWDPELISKINTMNKEHNYYVYILCNKRNGTLYTGVTNGLFKRTIQHKINKNKNSFTNKYKVNKLVYYEKHQYILEAINREKNIKAWKRKWKLELIEKHNPTWLDLFSEME